MERDAAIEKLPEFVRERADTAHTIKAHREPGSPDFTVDMCVGFDDDEVGVSFTFLDTGNDDEPPTYDPDIHVSNGDHAGLEEMHHALGCAVAEIKRLKFVTQCAELGLTYQTVGMQINIARA